MLVQGPLVFYWVFIAEVVDGVGDKESVGTITFDAHTLLEAYENMSLKFALSLVKIFTGKKYNFRSYDYSQVQIIRISGLSDIKLKELCCTLALCDTNEKAFDITTKYLIKSFYQVTFNI